MIHKYQYDVMIMSNGVCYSLLFQWYEPYYKGVVD